MILRLLKNEEKEILKDFLYEAIFIPEGIEPEVSISYKEYIRGR